MESYAQDMRSRSQEKDKTMRIYRAFINQPSTLQPLHKLDGVRCIVVDDPDKDRVILHFTEGDVHSMLADRLCISQIFLCKAEQAAVHPQDDAPTPASGLSKEQVLEIVTKRQADLEGDRPNKEWDTYQNGVSKLGYGIIMDINAADFNEPPDAGLSKKRICKIISDAANNTRLTTYLSDLRAQVHVMKVATDICAAINAEVKEGDDA